MTVLFEGELKEKVIVMSSIIGVLPGHCPEYTVVVVMKEIKSTKKIKKLRKVKEELPY